MKKKGENKIMRGKLVDEINELEKSAVEMRNRMNEDAYLEMAKSGSKNRLEIAHRKLLAQKIVAEHLLATVQGSDKAREYADTLRQELNNLSIVNGLCKTEMTNDRLSKTVQVAKKKLPALHATKLTLERESLKLLTAIKKAEASNDFTKASSLKQSRDDISERHTNIIWSIRLRTEEVSKESQVRLCNRRLYLVRQTITHLPLCKRCKSQTVLPIGVRQPNFPTINLQTEGWIHAEAPMELSLSCEKCEKRFSYLVDKPKQAKQKPGPKPHLPKIMTERYADGE
jgi:hypothetical protein